MQMTSTVRAAISTRSVVAILAAGVGAYTGVCGLNWQAQKDIKIAVLIYPCAARIALIYTHSLVADGKGTQERLVSRSVRATAVKFQEPAGG